MGKTDHLVSMLTLPHASCVNLGTFLNLSVPQLFVKAGSYEHLHHRAVLRIKRAH